MTSSDYWINRFVWEEAGLRFKDRGIYAVDFGTEIKVADWSETPWNEPQEATVP